MFLLAKTLKSSTLDQQNPSPGAPRYAQAFYKIHTICSKDLIVLNMISINHSMITKNEKKIQTNIILTISCSYKKKTLTTIEIINTNINTILSFHEPCPRCLILNKLKSCRCCGDACFENQLQENMNLKGNDKTIE